MPRLAPASPARRLLGLLSGLVLLSLISCRLLDPTPGPSPYRGNGGPGPGNTTASAEAGGLLYAAHCARCHGASAEGTTVAVGIQGRGNIAGVVRNGVRAMPAFAGMSDVDVSSIELFLARFGSGGLDTLQAGALFAAQCARCHGTDASGIVGNGPGLERQRGIAAVVRAGRGNMPGFPRLSDAQIASLETFLAGVPFERTGRNLYVRYCQACHGSDARGTNRGRGIRRELDELLEAVRQGPGEMPSFPELSNGDVNLIRAYIKSL